jgi:hypothetical protein
MYGEGMRRRVISALLMFAIGVVALQASAKKTGLEVGEWSSEKAIVTVQERGAEIEFQCANGTIDEQIYIAADGSFDVAGTFTPRGHGPTRDDAPAKWAARYKGKVHSDVMTFMVELPDSKVGPVEVKRGEHVVLKKCG